MAASIGLGASTAQAIDFTASATVVNTLTVTNVLDFDLGTVFATVQLINLGTPVPAQGSIAMAADFTLTLPTTNTVLPADFAVDAGGTLSDITDGTSSSAELVHSSGDPSVPSLWLTHFTVEDLSGGTVGTETATYDGVFPVTQNFGETAYIFNIGGTVTTEPTTSALAYQSGVYSGTFAVTASY